MNSGPPTSNARHHGFRLGDFLIENYPLIALLGVFGALTIYLGEIIQSIENNPDSVINSNYLTIGLLASLILFIIVSYVVCHRLLEEITDEPDSAGVFVGEIRPMTILFFVSFLCLFGTILYVSRQYIKALSTIATLSGLVVGWSLYGFIYRRIPPSQRGEQWEEEVGNIIKERIKTKSAARCLILAVATSIASVVGPNYKELGFTLGYATVFLKTLHFFGYMNIEKIVAWVSSNVLLGNGEVLYPLTVSIGVGLGVATITALLYMSIEIILSTYFRYENLKA